MKHIKTERQMRSGFSMIELMAVLIIMGLLITVVAENFMGKVDEARVKTTQANLKILHSAVEQFRYDTGHYPSEDEGLLVLVEAPVDAENYPEGGYLKSTAVPLDGWKHEFIYELSPENGKPFVIKSLGADNAEGGEKYDKDLFSTDL